jgi:hypothetical protein
MGKTYVFSEFGFGNHGPLLVLDELDRSGARRRQWQLLQKRFTLSWSEERYCIGRFDLATYESEPCPTSARITEESNRCRDCEYSSGFNPSFYNVPRHQISPQQAAYNARPHAVYLAYFGRGLLKVGISSEDRNRTRLLEQGALAAKIIARFENAYDARNFEARISKTAALREVVQAAAKRRALVTGLMSEDLAAELTAGISKVASALGSPLPLGDHVELLHSYFGDELPSIKEATDLTNRHVSYVSGICIGLVGDSLILSQAGRLFFFGLKTILSRVVRYEAEECRNAVEPEPSQLRLL